MTIDLSFVHATAHGSGALVGSSIGADRRRDEQALLVELVDGGSERKAVGVQINVSGPSDKYRNNLSLPGRQSLGRGRRRITNWGRRSRGRTENLGDALHLHATLHNRERQGASTALCARQWFRGFWNRAVG